VLTSLYYTSTELVESKNASFKVLIVVFLRIRIFWFVTLWRWMSGFQHVEECRGSLTQLYRVTSQNSQLYKFFENRVMGLQPITETHTVEFSKCSHNLKHLHL